MLVVGDDSVKRSTLSSCFWITDIGIAVNSGFALVHHSHVGRGRGYSLGASRITLYSTEFLDFLRSRVRYVLNSQVPYSTRFKEVQSPRIANKVCRLLGVRVRTVFIQPDQTMAPSL